MTDNYIIHHTDKGDVCISEDVVTSIIQTAVKDVDGVASLSSKGIKVSAENGKTISEISIMVKYGAQVTTVAKKVQDAVSDAVEGMTGFDAITNVQVVGIAFDKSFLKG